MKRLISIGTLAKFLGCSNPTVVALTKRGVLPQPTYRGKYRRWPAEILYLMASARLSSPLPGVK